MPEDVDLQRARGEFPILEQRNYLATHALGPMPRAALEDLEEYRELLLQRTAGIPAQLRAIEAMRGDLAQLVDALPDDIALCPSATAALAQIALALQPSVNRRRLLISAQNFPSTRFLWQAQAPRGFEPELVEQRLPATGERSVETLPIDERTAAVIVPWVAPYTGALIDLDALCQRCREVGALCIVDAYQGVGVVPLSLADPARRPDVLVAGNHKWLCAASMGLAFLYVDPRLAVTLSPAAPGWLGDAGFPQFSEVYRPAAGARRFQQGTPAVEPIFGARAGLRFVLRHGVERLHASSLRLTQALLEVADDCGLAVATPRSPSGRGGTVTLAFQRLEVSAQQRLVGQLSQAGIDVDFRPGGGMRVSPHPCATLDDVESAVSTISRLSAVFSSSAPL
ncbi:MAG: aminotransferase class V-fold PLP-dependent enzyme [Myxococcales bacterium]|nr:aminotransferase class V-fold PLP-dependent enzyme [Myxococcales bacterium]